MKKTINQILGNTDIYLIDQILKGRYTSKETILDAGCGEGRNMHWFYHNDFHLLAIDRNAERIVQAKTTYPKQQKNFQVADLTQLPYANNSVDHIINCAVLHFAQSETEFRAMFAELVRVLKPGGTLFIRMTADIGVENFVTPLANGCYYLNDDTSRFLLTRMLLADLIKEHQLIFLEPLKSTNVADMRAMATLVLGKRQ